MCCENESDGFYEQDRLRPISWFRQCYCWNI